MRQVPVVLRIAAVATLLCDGCRAWQPSPLELLAVEPGITISGVKSSVTIHGRGFSSKVRVSYVDSERSIVHNSFALSLVSPGQSIALSNVELQSPTELSATVPAHVPAGVYTLELVDPRGRIASLAAALEITTSGQQPVGPPCRDASDCANDPCSSAGQCDSGFCVYDKDADRDGRVDEACGGDDCDDACDQCWTAHAETCDGLDNDCNAATPDGLDESAFGDACDGPDDDWCDEGMMACDGVALTCTDVTDSSVEIPGDETDQDCDGREICFVDADGDGYRSNDTLLSLDSDCQDDGEASASEGIDCDDEPSACGAGCFPGNPAADICDGADNDCDGVMDGEPELVWYADADGDGYGDASSPRAACSQPAGYVADDTDCADTPGSDPACNGLDGSNCHPRVAGSDSCDGADNDCDGSVDEDGPCPPWYADAGYTERKQLCLNGARIAGALTNFPVLVSFTDAELSAALVNGFDILFTDDTGTTKLDHERESWDSATGELVAWVRFPALAADVDEVFYVYFDKDSEGLDQANPAGVWDVHHRGVWHLNEDVVDEASTGTHVDSTGSFNGDQYGNSRAPGRIAGGQDFDGIDDIIELGTTTIIDGRSAFTISAWVKLDGIPGAADRYSVYSRRDMASGTGALSLGVGDYFPVDTYHVVITNDGVWHDHFANSQTAVGAWTHIAGTYDGVGTVAHFLDGNPDGSSPYTEPIVVGGLPQYIGVEALHTQFDGMIDEVRVSRTNRSAAWIKTSYDNQSDPDLFLDCTP